MITPELLSYIRGEFAKGRTREEVDKTLTAYSNWAPADLNEAFRAVIPMQSFTTPNIPAPQTVLITVPVIDQKNSSSLFWKVVLIVCIVGVFVAVWFYRTPLMNLSNSYFSSKASQTPPVAENIVVPPSNRVVSQPPINIVKDCGSTNSPDLKNPLAYKDDAVLTCLGNSAISCIPTKAILSDALLPTIFQITKEKNQNCNFKLSYGDDSTLVDVTGNKLASQFILCPIGIVKAVDETKKVQTFNTPNMSDLTKYAAQIYFYGSIGIFMENNVDQTKIRGLGCSGPYIDSVVESYNKVHGKI